MESKAGSILALIGGILTFLLSLLFLIFFIITLVTPSENVTGSRIPFVILFFILFAWTLVAGIFKIVASRMMRDPEKTRKGGIIALIFAILTAGELLSLIGGILGIVQGEKE